MVDFSHFSPSRLCRREEQIRQVKQVRLPLLGGERKPVQSNERFKKTPVNSNPFEWETSGPRTRTQYHTWLRNYRRAVAG